MSANNYPLNNNPRTEDAAAILLRVTATLTSLDRQRVISQIGQGQLESPLAREVWAKFQAELVKAGIIVEPVVFDPAPTFVLGNEDSIN